MYQGIDQSEQNMKYNINNVIKSVNAINMAENDSVKI